MANFRWRRVGVAAVPALVLCAGTASFAGKPGGGGTVPPSTPAILYVQNADYDSVNGGDLWVMDADGQNQRLVRKGLEGHADWLYDGAPVTDPMKRPIVFGGSSSDGYGIWRICADGTGLAKLVSTTSPVFRVGSSPVPAPDGQYKLAFEMTNGAEHEICVVNHDGTELVWVTNTAGYWERGARWAPEADRLVFTRPPAGTSGGRHDVLVVGLAASGGQLVVGAEVNLTIGLTGSFQQPDWARTSGSNLVAVTRGSGDPFDLAGDVVVLDAAHPGGAPVVLTGADGPANARQPNWSPDDSKLVLNGSAANYPTGQLWTVTQPGGVSSVLVARGGQTRGNVYPANRTCPVWRR